jgi:hypothetical protein
MRTVDLIETLTTNVEAGDRRQMSRALARAVAVGAAVTLLRCADRTWLPAPYSK